MEAVIPFSQLNGIPSAGGQDGGRPPLWANANEETGLIVSSKNISDTGDGNSTIKGLFSICSEGLTPAW